MNKRNKIQETDESSFEQYKNKVDYDIILEGTIGYDITGVENSSTPSEEQLQDGEEKIFKQLEQDMNDEDYLYDMFKDTGIARGKIYGEFSDQFINDNKLYFKFGISKQDATKELDTNEIKEYFEGFLENLDINTDIVSVAGWSNEEEEVEPTYVKLNITGTPEVKILKGNNLKESIDKENKYKLVLYSKIGDNFEPDVFIKTSIFDKGIVVADNYMDAQSYTQQEANKIINEFEKIPENKKSYEIRMVPEGDAEQFEKDNIKECKLIDSIDRKLVMEGKLTFTNKSGIKSIILDDDGIMELYENKKLMDSKPFSKLGVRRLCKSIIQEGYSIYITTGEYPVYNSKKYDTVDTEEQAQDIVAELNSQGIGASYEKDETLQEDIKSDEIKDSNGDNIDLKQTKQNIEQSIEKVDELQDLKDELQDKVDNLYNESKIEEEKITSFVSTPFTQQLLSTEEIYNLKLEEELTVEQVAYITKLFGSLEEFKNSLIQLTDIASMPPQIHFISIDEYIKEMEKEFDKEVN